VTVTVEVATGVAVVVLMFSEDVTADPLGVTEPGVKPQIAPVGKPRGAQLKTTVPVKPLVGVMVTV
jgi:hypothetical protein